MNNKPEKHENHMFLDYMKKQKEKVNNTNKVNNVKDSQKRNKITDNIFSFFGWIWNSINKLIYFFIQNRYSMMILSLLLAIIFYVSIKDEDTVSVRSVKNVEVKIVNLSDDVIVEGVPDTVDMYLEGTSLQIQTATLKEYYVYCDLADYKEGTYTDVPLSVSGISSNVKTIILPESIDVSIYTKVTQNFEFGYEYLNEENITNEVVVQPTVDYDTVQVSGKQTDIDNIASVKLVFDFDNLNISNQITGTFKAYDANGEEITTVYFIDDDVTVTLKTVEAKKEITIKPIFTGLNNTYAIDSIDYGIDTLYYYGTSSILENYSELKVDIDVSKIDENGYIGKVAINPPSGVICNTSELNVSVKVGLRSTKTFANVPIQIDGDGSYTLSSNTCTVVLTGSLNRLNTITIDDIVCKATIKDDSITSVDLSAYCKDDNLISVESIEPANITVQKQ